MQMVWMGNEKWSIRPEPSLRSPGRRCLLSFFEGHTSLGAAVGVHDVDVVLAGSVGAEGQIPTVRRPAGILVVARVGGEPFGSAAVRRHGKDIEVSVGLSHKDDPVKR